MQEKVLTVSIASYNTERFIDETVRSLFADAAHMEKLEIIIVNDGSKDQTSDLAHKLAKEYPGTVLVIDKENGGYGSTINASLAIARGKYYKLLDGDDWYETAVLPEFLDFLEDADADMVVSPYYEVRDSRKLVDHHAEIPGHTVPYEAFRLQNRFLAMHEIAIKTDSLRALGKKIAEHCFYTDTEYAFYCILASETIARFEKPVYLYRLGVEGQSVSLEGTRKHYKEMPIVAMRIMKACSDSDEAARNTTNKKAILDHNVCRTIYHTFMFYMALENPLDYKKELMDLDHQIKTSYPTCYALGNGSKLVRVVRMLRFHFYEPLCSMVLKKFYGEP